MNKTYFNSHAHTYYSNVSTTDVIISPLELVNRTLELKHTAITATEHGNTLSKYELYELAQKNHLKYIYGVEAYFVIDNKSQDASNGHIILYAINDEGYLEINELISNANTDGFYYKARIDIAGINKLNPKNVIITTACVGGFLNKNREQTDFFMESFRPFIQLGHFFLEVANHNTEKQKEYNEFLLKLSIKERIPLVFGADTHLIELEDSKYRDAFLLSKGIRYEDEDGWFIDFPSYEDAVLRFQAQGILVENQITEAMENTLVIQNMIEDYSILKDKDMKIPILESMKHLTQQERNDELERIIWDEFDKKIKPKDLVEKKKYVKQIKYEIDEIVGCNMCDYFLFNYHMVKLGREKYNGVLTYTGRGSAPSYILCMLLGFTTIDRNKYEVPILPERFLTKDRILLSRTPPDIDMNTANPFPFYQAQQELIGEKNTFPMISLGRLHEKSAWKIYAKANNIEFELANKVSTQIEEYEKAKKYEDDLEEDEESSIKIEQYISPEYLSLFKDSNRFLGVVTDVKIHPCAYIVADRNVISNIGLIKAKENFCVAIEGKNAEKWGYLKNDLLSVSTVSLTKKIYEKIGIPQHTTTELVDIIEDDCLTWDIYKNGQTILVNQMEKPNTRDKGKIYCPKNITDLSTLVAVIRPGSSSIMDKVLKREKYTFGVKEIDDILFSHTGVGSYVIFQETIMSMLEYAGIDKKQTYDLMKSISKKRKDIIMKSKKQFIEGIVSKITKGEING